MNKQKVDEKVEMVFQTLEKSKTNHKRNRTSILDINLRSSMPVLNLEDMLDLNESMYTYSNEKEYGVKLSKSNIMAEVS